MKLIFAPNVSTYAPTARRSTPHCIAQPSSLMKNPYIFSVLLNHIIWLNLNLNKWCGATPPSGMALFHFQAGQLGDLPPQFWRWNPLIRQPLKSSQATRNSSLWRDCLDARSTAKVFSTSSYHQIWGMIWTWQQKTGLNSAMNDNGMLPGSYPHRKYMICMVWNII